MACFNDAEAHASEERGTRSRICSLSSCFNDAEAHASEEQVEGNGCTRRHVASMMPRLTPRKNTLAQWEQRHVDGSFNDAEAHASEERSATGAHRTYPTRFNDAEAHASEEPPARSSLARCTGCFNDAEAHASEEQTDSISTFAMPSRLQ